MKFPQICIVLEINETCLKVLALAQKWQISKTYLLSENATVSSKNIFTDLIHCYYILCALVCFLMFTMFCVLLEY